MGTSSTPTDRPSGPSHATQRLWQRYGAQIRIGDLARKIERGESKLLRRNHGAEVHEIPFGPTWVTAVFSGGKILTVLPQTNHERPPCSPDLDVPEGPSGTEVKHLLSQIRGAFAECHLMIKTAKASGDEELLERARRKSALLVKQKKRLKSLLPFPPTSSKNASTPPERSPPSAGSTSTS